MQGNNEKRAGEPILTSHPGRARAGFFLVTLICSISASAGLIEMPETRETPDLEESSMLLDMDIPGVRDRDPNPDSGPRLNVREFRIQGLVEYPKLGITRQEIIDRVEAIRFDLMGEGKLLESGYTLSELGEVSDLIAEIESETQDRHVTPVELQRLVFLIREQRRRRGITLGMIETVADTITRYYRERGFVLAKAYIPEQHVRDGVVTLTLLLGELGDVQVHNNSRYSEGRLKSAFSRDLAKPVVSSTIEERLFLLSDLPGLAVQGFFEPGSQVGDTRLNVNILAEERYSAAVRSDNHGSERTGEYRAYLDLLWNNPTGTSDQLHVGVLNSFKPRNSTYGSIRYNTNIFHPRLRLSVGASTNDFAIGSAGSSSRSAVGIEGESMVMDASVRYQIKRSRTKNFAASLRYSEVESQISISGFRVDFLDDVIRNTEFSFEFDRLNDDPRMLHQGNMRLISSQFIKGAEDAQPESVYIGRFGYSLLSFIKVPLLGREDRFVFNVSGQYAGHSLASVNQFALAGPGRARGFSINEYYADDGVVLSSDWLLNTSSLARFGNAGQTLSRSIQPYLFMDMAYGKSHAYQTGAPSSDASLADAGLGLRFNVGQSIRGNFSVGRPLSYRNSAVEDDLLKKTSKMFFEMQMVF